MTDFRSNEELFAAVARLTARLELEGHLGAAAEIKDGVRGLNGLTDGWAHFLARIEKVRSTDGPRLTADDRDALAALRTAARGVVYRR